MQVDRIYSVISKRGQESYTSIQNILWDQYEGGGGHMQVYRIYCLISKRGRGPYATRKNIQCEQYEYTCYVWANIVTAKF